MSRPSKVAVAIRDEPVLVEEIKIIGLVLVPLAAVAFYGYQQGMLNKDELWALGLSTFAGLSTTVGAAIAVVRQPDDASLAFLLGLALGVMATLSVVELWVNNALEHGLVPVTVATLLGAAAYYFAQPFFPEFELPKTAEEPEGGDGSDMASASSSSSVGADSLAPSQLPRKRVDGDAGAASHGELRSREAKPQHGGAVQKHKPKASIPARELFRLGLLMAFTMTLHNMPEGLAVAFSSYTNFGVVMAVAIALHNIPEGIIVAAPIFAATGSRSKALLIATASGLSEPVGALLALVFVKPYLTEDRLHLMLAATGGLMLAVCVVELWPEAKKCKHDVRAWQGIALGFLLMAVTLAADV